jgi:PilZ domain-containing protein
MANNRRDEGRVPMNAFLTEYVEDRPYRGMITNLSERGLCVQRLLRPTHRPNRVVQLEFQLPGTSEIIWARGEACFDELEVAPFGPVGVAAGARSLGPLTTIHSSGIRVVALAGPHARLMRDYVREKRRLHWKAALARIAQRQRH